MEERSEINSRGAGVVAQDGADVAVEHGAAGAVQGTTVIVRQAGAQSIHADSVVIRQGGALVARTQRLEMHQSGAVVAKTQLADLTASKANLMLAAGDVHMDLSGAHVLLARGDVTMDQSGVQVLAARNVSADHCGTILLLAGRVEGTVNAAFGPRESLIFGAVAGAVAGLTFLLGRGWRKRSPRMMGRKRTSS